MVGEGGWAVLREGAYSFPSAQEVRCATYRALTSLVFHTLFNPVMLITYIEELLTARNSYKKDLSPCIQVVA